ncbi:MAG: GNAT family protein [Acidimicrobiaceae bacterium]|nr:GNAT family protein [Acidimicrobiaceae bacterium]MCY4279345.1 GNAT family protein [Acidimicrobiaceae bacterium]MCY4294980.1 GNAT family protein [Acidimicrobiaceae bacterium]
MSTLLGRRVLLRPLTRQDFAAWQQVRRRNRERLTRWEPQAVAGRPDNAEDQRAFADRCNARRRERQHGTGYGFGVFVNKSFRGEMNLSAIQRGPFQSCYVGYWIDEAVAGNGYTPEALVVVARFAFEELALHRLQVAIVPRNTSSLRVVEKLGLRYEGLAERYLEINGVWEDHHRFAMTAEEWRMRSEELTARWVAPRQVAAHPASSRRG